MKNIIKKFILFLTFVLILISCIGIISTQAVNWAGSNAYDYYF